MREFESYGVVKGHDASTVLDQMTEAVLVRGFAVMSDVIPPNEITRLTERLQEVYAKQCAEIGGEAVLNELNDADIVRCPLAYDSAFLDLALNSQIIAMLKRLLGSNFVLLMQNGIINRPDRLQTQTRWHRDLNYQHWVCSEPLAISALVCLEDFNRKTGGTTFLPGSHRFPQFPSSALIAESEVTVEAPRGSVLFFDSMVFHRAGVNSSPWIRCGINHVVGRPILSQQIDIPTMLARPEPADAWLAGFLGYRWNPVQSVRSWRLRKLAQSGQAPITNNPLSVA